MNNREYKFIRKMTLERGVLKKQVQELLLKNQEQAKALREVTTKLLEGQEEAVLLRQVAMGGVVYFHVLLMPSLL
eukprot:SAG11_NODE_5585_length_1517_cov_1.241890_1_plen_75_part_00